MASAGSRLVTWVHLHHLCFSGRRFWRPHPDLDRVATPALPPGGGRPLSWIVVPARRRCGSAAERTAGSPARPVARPRDTSAHDHDWPLAARPDGRRGPMARPTATRTGAQATL